MLTTARSVRSSQTLFRVEPAEISAVVQDTCCDSAHVASTGTDLIAADPRPELKELPVQAITKTKLADEPRSCSKSGEAIVKEDFERQLAKSGYSLPGMSCQVDQQEITLEGRVCRYYHLQVAIQAAQRVGSGRRIISKVEVMPSSFVERRCDSDSNS